MSEQTATVRFERCGQMSMGGWVGVWRGPDGVYSLQLVTGPFRQVSRRDLRGFFGRERPVGRMEYLEGEELRAWWLTGPGLGEPERFVSQAAAEAWLALRWFGESHV